MENRWKHFKTVYDGDYCELEGVNIWDNKWETDYKTVTVEDPLYNEKKQFNIYWIDTPTRRIEFVAGEFSNCVWGFYTKSKIDIREKTTSAKKPTYLTVKDHSVSGEEFQLLHN